MLKPLLLSDSPLKYWKWEGKYPNVLTSFSNYFQKNYIFLSPIFWIYWKIAQNNFFRIIGETVSTDQDGADNIFFSLIDPAVSVKILYIKSYIDGLTLVKKSFEYERAIYYWYMCVWLWSNCLCYHLWQTPTQGHT